MWFTGLDRVERNEQLTLEAEVRRSETGQRDHLAVVVRTHANDAPAMAAGVHEGAGVQNLH